MQLAKALVFEWQNAIFTGSIVFWMIYLFISLLGSGGGDAFSGHAVDNDFDVHHDIHTGFSLLSYLGLGRCPVSIVLMLLGVSWGFVGLLCNGIFHKLWIIPPILYFWVSAAIALVVAMPFTSAVSRVVAKIIPRKGTTAISLDKLVGCTGEASVTIDSKSGRVRVRDEYNTIHNLYCKTDGLDDPIPPNTEVLILSRTENGMFLVRKKSSIIAKS